MKKQTSSAKRLHESGIRPGSLFQRWLEILEKELHAVFHGKKPLVSVTCPGCGASKAGEAFTKFEFAYRRCGRCGSLFVSPRPSPDALRDFYRTSRAMQFYKDEIVRRSTAERHRHQILPLYDWFTDYVEEYAPDAKIAVDYGPKYMSLLGASEAYKRFIKVFLVEPVLFHDRGLPSRAVRHARDLGAVKEKADVFLALDVLNREFSPADFLKQVSKVCGRGALLFLTANTISGFEYQILGEHASRLVPPDRLNLLSVEALRKLLAENGFEVLELTTPGKLDVEIVANTVKQNPLIPVPEFFKYLFKHRDAETLESLQDFLQLSNLSSYLRAVAKKK